MDEMKIQLIKQYADEIRAELAKDGQVAYLFGEPFDKNDPDSVLVAAVLIEQIKLLDLRINNISTLIGFTK